MRRCVRVNLDDLTVAQLVGDLDDSLFAILLLLIGSVFFLTFYLIAINIVTVFGQGAMGVF